MIKIHRAKDRGRSKIDWLDSYHTFSFSDFYDPTRMNFKTLRVINEDKVEPSSGFSTHAHRDMEIITYVLKGSLEHKDSLGNGSVIVPGQIQKMSAGTGILHSEWNPSKTEKVHFLQIWITPDKKGIDPSYEQIDFKRSEMKNEWTLLASGSKKAGKIYLRQDADLFGTLLGNGKSREYRFRPGRSGWIQVASGEIRIGKETLAAGDGAQITDEVQIEATSLQDASELILFDLG